MPLPIPPRSDAGDTHIARQVGGGAAAGRRKAARADGGGRDVPTSVVDRVTGQSYTKLPKSRIDPETGMPVLQVSDMGSDLAASARRFLPGRMRVPPDAEELRRRRAQLKAEQDAAFAQAQEDFRAADEVAAAALAAHGPRRPREKKTRRRS